MSTVPQTAIASPSPAVGTPVAALQPGLRTVPYRGALTPHSFSQPETEFAALTTSTGIYDLGYLSSLRVTGSDRVRWLNGMVTNTIQSLEENHWNYSFLLSAQGRILGDATIFHFSDHFLLQTDRAQIAPITAHLDHFIIMDDVELQELDASTTTIGIAGPQAAALLNTFGLAAPTENAFITAKLEGVEVTLVHAYSPVLPRFELRLPTASLSAIWNALTAAGAVPCGLTATEALRIFEATPLYGVDILERHLVQETGQSRALNFNKGCYLGQEIVERIRSRATIHRTLRQFALSGAAKLEAGKTLELIAEQSQRNPVGELTSIAHYQLPAFTGSLALGFVRTEVLERKLSITYSDGTASPLDAPPSL
jgi:folate-binding protein YgfZ